ncbi:MAG: sporulation protein YqfC [Clostridiales bacterium]|uniref:sporulation protein YqfC n=1 Tax=Clostridium sp. N3C TaxID=1776758 RepID=UPI00092E04CF|nr:sporulation protein YqfC [Clostridium sp. N3C]NLZ48414.1 sporulation protein YqfC [Clostridiales bacterium]SCN21785.1 sporulation protein YqfC [Clostridium sp. N3C]
MEDKINKAKESLANQLDLPRDVMLNIPKISVTGNNEITIENHKGIVFFGDKEVRINSNVGLISILGEEFEILFLGGSTITISGKFKTINYERDML